jgi:serine palmitoyltransferase
VTPSPPPPVRPPPPRAVPASYAVEPTAAFVIAQYFPNALDVLIEGDTRLKTPWVSRDFLGLSASPKIAERARSALEEYTVGSCGPRGFYGTTTAHLQLETSIAKFLGTEEAITYSDETATICSVIPAFAKRGDVLLVDAGVSWGIQQGSWLARAKVVWWAHNDVDDLASKLEAVREADEKRPGSSIAQRRFIVVEGLYASSGALCPLPKIVELAKKYRWRIILDDSLGFGVLGVRHA